MNLGYEKLGILDEPGKTMRVNLVPNENLRDLLKEFPTDEPNLLNYLETTEDEFAVYRKNAFKSRQVWLDQYESSQLPQRYKLLMQGYNLAKREYKKQLDAFATRSNRSIYPTSPEWLAFFGSQYFLRSFPDLMPNSALDDLPAHALACEQLAVAFGRKTGYMRKLIANVKMNQKIENQIESK